MSNKYIPLYRKYRPQNLSEVVGQEHVKKALTNAIELNKISHAYLFTGPRGTGKTSIARILAKSLNCQKGPTVKPCEKCPSCMDVKNSTPIDVIEIDAASNRKVEDTQNILEKIQYVPVNGKYKIYIIDEVHMLSAHAFNALLKTLEEPPENVIFILATTEPQKVLETITSRCQRFDFRRITTDDIVNHLKEISKKEEINIDDDALFTIAKSVAGGMRDSLALLDQVSVLDTAKKITTDDINKLLGRLSFDVVNKLADCIINSDIQAAIEQLDTIYNSGNEPSQILTNLLTYLKNLLIVKNCQKSDLLLDLTQLNEVQIKALKEQVQKVETHQITALIEKTASYIKELKTTTNQQLWLEVAIIDLANLTENTTLAELQQRLINLEAGDIPELPASYSVKPVLPMPVSAPTPEPVQQVPQKMSDSSDDDVPPLAKAEPEPQVKEAEQKQEPTAKQPNMVEEETPVPISKPAQPNELKTLWVSLLQNISSAPTVAMLNQHAVPIGIDDNNIIIGCVNETFLKGLTSETKKKAIEDGALKMFGKSVNVTIKLADSKEISYTQTEKKNSTINPPQPAVKPRTFMADETPVQEEISEAEDYAKHELEKKKSEQISQSDQVSMVVELFDGKFIDD